LAESGSPLILAAWLGLLQASCSPSKDVPPTATPTAKSATATSGNISPTQTYFPVEESTDSPIALGANPTCTLIIGNGVVCWGNNRYGQLGNGARLRTATYPWKWRGWNNYSGNASGSVGPGAKSDCINHRFA
jgi:hypothetical protein